MAPPGRTALHATGGTTSTETLIRAAHLMLDSAGVAMSPSTVSRLVRDYQHRVAANGFSFFEFLANTVQLSVDQRRDARQNAEVAQVVSYADPVGEQAVHNVMRGVR